MPAEKKKPAKAAAAKSASLLVELRTEELPPKSLKRLSEVFRDSLFEALKQNGFAGEASVAEAFATPRRLAVRISQVAAVQADRTIERRGPAVAAGFDAKGQPTPALMGFAKSCGVELAKLERQIGEKGEQFVFRAHQKGEPLGKLLAGLVEAALKKLPVAKTMRWGNSEVQFVRPVHGLVMLHGKNIVLGSVLGLRSGNITLGHRFLSMGWITIPRADDYERVLKTRGKVIVDFVERRDLIVEKLVNSARQVKPGTHVLLHDYKKKNGEVVELTSSFLNPDTNDRGLSRARMDVLGDAVWILRGNGDLLDEVTAIVEWPEVYAGEFGRDLLTVPAVCISLSMQKNQKYFALVDNTGALLPNYLLVSNILDKKPEQIVKGNARVLRARLTDAKFFYEQDQKMKLAERVPRLAGVVYHNKLGSQLERVQRLQKLAAAISEQLGYSVTTRSQTERAAYLCKADLLTEMVGEFPELQALMGYLYAKHDGESEEVLAGVREQYLPRFAGDKLPSSQEGMCLALADKLDTLVGIYGIGLVPTGDKDPFGLRRSALGVVRIVVEKVLALDVIELLQLVRGLFPNGVVADSVAQDLHQFMLERLKPYLRDQGFEVNEIDALLSLAPTRFDQVLPRLKALRDFRTLPEAEALAAANKRIINILKKTGREHENTDPAKLAEPAERALFEAMQKLTPEVESRFNEQDYTGALQRLAGLKQPVDAFFESVMVMADDPALRANRLALLGDLKKLMNKVADISRLAA